VRRRQSYPRTRCFFPFVELWILGAWPMAAMASTVRGMRVVYHKDGIDPINAVQCTVLPHITANVIINDDAGPEAGCTTGPAKIMPTRT
jgi:hypothetical protein